MRGDSAGLAVDARATVRGFTLRARFVAPAGITVVFGPSATGKTLLLDLVAGLVRADRSAGEGGATTATSAVSLDGRTLDGAGVFVPPHERPTGYAPQHAALWPHRSVRQHIEPFAASREHAARLIDGLGLRALAERLPARLSGGERQRVALGRALARKPRLLLLDEPLTALDRKARLELVRVLREESAESVVLLVTHDLGEARALADRTLVAAAGDIHEGPLPDDDF